MDFGLTEEQEMLQETVRGFVANECPPSKLRELFDAGAGHDPALWQGLVDMGLTGLIVPEEYGGVGLELLELSLVSEVLGEGAVPGPFFGHSLATISLIHGGDEEQKRTWLPRFASGESVATYAVAEEHSRWSPSDWSVEEKDAKLTGVKYYVSHADISDVVVVGISRGRLAIVLAGAPGLSIEPMGGIDRTRPIFKIVFDETPATLLANGQDASGRVQEAALVMLAADSFGVASSLLRMSVAYAKTREQFGMVIAQFQSVKHQLARLATEIDPTRALYWYAAHAFDHLRDESERSAALAKAHITDRAMDTARHAVELHGGLGFTWECDVQMWFKRAMFDRAAFGTPEMWHGRIATLGGW